MGKMILVTGGARSGKSTFAEEKVKEFGDNVVYVATSIPFDEEMKLRVQKHREQRPIHWETIEAYKNLDIILKDKLINKSAVLLDCVTIMVSNIMFEKNIDWNNLKKTDIVDVEEIVKEELTKLVNLKEKFQCAFVLVTNELGMGIVPENALARIFRDVAGRANQLLAQASDEVYLCVSGIPMRIK